MSTKTTSHELLNAVDIINKKLTDRAKQGVEGIYWESMGLDSDGKVAWESSDSIYCGVGGIALYFLRQFKVLGNKDHLKIAQQAIQWCRWYAKNGPAEQGAYLTGKIGVALTMLELNELSPQKSLAEEAIQIASKAGESDSSEWEICDYINGTAGRIHGLLHIYQKSRNEEILHRIDQLTLDLIKKAWVYKDGLYWDRSGQQVCGLCGLSHGSGGIGYTFLELAKYFDNPALNLLARQALRYEDYHFNKKAGNWPDMRRGSYTELDLAANKNEFNKGNIAYFERKNEMNAWCHGAAGVGLVRLEAWRQLGDKSFLKDAKVAIKKTVETDVTPEELKANYTLCHGSGGNAEIFIRAYEVTGDRKELKKAEKVVAKALQFFTENNYYGSGYAQGNNIEDVSLFMGLAGVGYFYLRTLYPESFPSLLIPSVQEGTYGKKLVGFKVLGASEHQLKAHLFERFFPETIKLASPSIFDFTEEKLYKGFVKAVSENLKASPNKELKRAFKREKKIYDFDLAAPSHAWLAVKMIVQSEKAPQTVELSAHYKLDPDVMLLSSNGEYHIISRHSRGIQEEQVSMFTYQVLKAFTHSEKASKVTARVSTMFGELSAEEKKEVDQAIADQIGEAVNSGKILKA